MVCNSLSSTHTQAWFEGLHLDSPDHDVQIARVERTEVVEALRTAEVTPEPVDVKESEDDERRGSMRYRVVSCVGGSNVATLVALTGARSRLLSLASLNRPAIEIRRHSAASTTRQEQHRLTDAEVVALAAAYQAGSEITELATRFRIHRHTAAAHLRHLAIPLRRPGLAITDVPEVIRLYGGEGWSLVRLGKKFGCDAETVRRRLLEAGVPTRKPWERP